MGTYNLPRNVKGEGRILFIFTRKSAIFTLVGSVVGLLFYLIFSLLGLTIVGIIFVAIFALIGFGIGTLKVPNIQNIKWTKVNAGEKLDDVIKRAFIFKRKANRIYIYKEEETDDK